jgi:hypothetical protein
MRGDALVVLTTRLTEIDETSTKLVVLTTSPERRLLVDDPPNRAKLDGWTRSEDGPGPEDVLSNKDNDNRLDHDDE